MLGDLFLGHVVDEARDEDFHVTFVEPIRERGDEADADDLIVEPHASYRGGRRLLALEQAGARRTIAHHIEAAIRDGSVEVGEVHVVRPAREEVREKSMHHVDSVFAATQHAFGLAHEGRAIRAVRGCRITGSCHLGCRL